MQMSTRGYAQMIRIAAPAARAWSACTQASGLGLWYATDALVDPRPGGRWRMRRRDGALCEATIDVWDERRRLRLIYLTPPAGAAIVGGATLVDDVLFDERDGQALIRVLGSGVPSARDWDEPYVHLRQAWAYYLGELKRALEGAPGADAP